MKTMTYALIIIATSICIIFYISFKFNTAETEKEIARHKKEIQKAPTIEDKKTMQEDNTKEVIANRNLPFTEQDLQERLHDKNPYRLAEAIAMLEIKGGKESVEQLEELFKSPTPSVIIDSVAALGRMKSKESVDNLEELYSTNKVRVDGYQLPIRNEIIVSLGNIGDERAVELLGEEFKSNESLMYKDLLLDAHEKIGSKKSLPYLEEYLEFLKANPGPEDFPELRFLINESKKKTERIIEEIKSK